MTRHVILSASLLTIFVWASSVTAQAAPPKWFEVEGAVNSQPSFMLRGDVNHKDRVYREGDKLIVRAVTEADCFLYMLYFSGDKAAVLFPNKFDVDNLVKANQPIEVPRTGTYNIVCRPPFGSEVLHVVASKTKLKLFSDEIEKNFKVEPVTEVTTQDLRQMVQRIQSQDQKDWAEARIEITTLPRNDPPPKSQRFAVCIGISEYESSRIQALQVAHLDAERMKTSLQERSGVTDITVLTNKQATREAIENAIFKDLVKKSSPGDTVYIFFSCHGGRAADTNGDEADGFDEYIVPHDGVLGKPETMILDDTFARWMEELDGRKVAIILDNCYSGGASKSAKALNQPTIGGKGIDFMDGEFRRAKDIGQNNVVVLAACQANQLAWEIPDPSKGSVLTFYLIQSLTDEKADANGDGRLSVKESYEYCKNPVSEFVTRTFNAQQNLVLIDNANDSIFLRE
jgi:hypothetical protein